MNRAFIPLVLALMMGHGELFAQDWMSGAWAGTGYQIDGQQWWVELEIEESDILISYPDLACSGEWQLDRTSTLSVHGTEVILLGTSNCDQHAEVLVRPLGNQYLLVQYFLRWYHPEEPIATAVLERRVES